MDCRRHAHWGDQQRTCGHWYLRPSRGWNAFVLFGRTRSASKSSFADSMAAAVSGCYAGRPSTLHLSCVELCDFHLRRRSCSRFLHSWRRGFFRAPSRATKASGVPSHSCLSTVLGMADRLATAILPEKESGCCNLRNRYRGLAAPHAQAGLTGSGANRPRFRSPPPPTGISRGDGQAGRMAAHPCLRANF